jgi:Fusaric acid resistance protein-like
VTQLVAKIFRRWSEAWREALASALAAALAWVLAERLFGHQQPIFAPISAIVCLSPGIPSHIKQTVGLVLGVATGIVIGELSLVLPNAFPLLKITLTAFLAMIVAASYGQAAVVPIRSVGDSGCSVRSGDYRIGKDDRRRGWGGCRFPLQPISFDTASKPPSQNQPTGLSS